MVRHILITGAAGSGTSTLAAALASELGAAHLEADDFLWLPSNPPYQHLADKNQRGGRLLEAMQAAGRTVVAGSVMGWGQALEDAFELVVFLYVPAQLRLQRLQQREVERFGAAKPEFMAWAAGYDDGDGVGRSLRRHLQWLAGLGCVVVRLEGDMGVEERARRVLGVVRGD